MHYCHFISNCVCVGEADMVKNENNNPNTPSVKGLILFFDNLLFCLFLTYFKLFVVFLS